MGSTSAVAVEVQHGVEGIDGEVVAIRADGGSVGADSESGHASPADGFIESWRSGRCRRFVHVLVHCSVARVGARGGDE